MAIFIFNLKIQLGMEGSYRKGCKGFIEALRTSMPFLFDKSASEAV